MNPEIKTLFQEYLKLTEGNKAAAASLVVAHFLASSRNLPVVNQPDGSNVAEKEKGPSTQIGSDDQFAELAKARECLDRLQLYTKGKAVNRKRIEAGNYGIPLNDEAVNDLGSQIDIIPLARRPKAIDMTDTRQCWSTITRIARSSSGSPRSRWKRNRSACTAHPSWSSSESQGASWNSSAAANPPAARPRRFTPSCR